MAIYRCFFCKREVEPELVRKRVRCPYCGSKILYKPRTVRKRVKAR